MSAPKSSGVRRLASLFQAAREPVFLLDDEQRLIYVNPAWELLTGRVADVVLGLRCRPQLADGDGDLDGIGGAFAPPSEALEGSAAGQICLVIRADGERIWRRVEYWPWHDASPTGGLIGILGVVSPADAPARVAEAESQKLRAELAEVRERLRERRAPEALIGRGPAHRRLIDQVLAAAATDLPALIVGEPGTGKRTVARMIHARGFRSSAPLLPFDCGALPPEVLDRELFAADAATPGFRAPEGATVLLVDAMELPRDIQARLVEAMREPRVRVEATTSIDPEAARGDDRLRDDLFYALTGLVIRLAPLRERLDELPLIAQHLLERANLRGDRRRSSFRADAVSALLAYDWPGNVRELARVVDAAHARAEGDLIQATDLPAAIRGHLSSSYEPPRMPPRVTPLDATLEQLERRLIEQALQRARQNKSRAAEFLGISRPRLYRRIKELEIPDESEPNEDPPSTASNGT